MNVSTRLEVPEVFAVALTEARSSFAPLMTQRMSPRPTNRRTRTSFLLRGDHDSGNLAPKLDAEFGADSVGDGVGVKAHERLRFGFDHDSGESFGAAVADDYSA